VVDAKVSITANSIELKEGGAVVYTFLKDSFAVLSDVVAEINLGAYAGWSASLSDPIYGQLNIDSLDHVTDVGALSAAGEKPARIKKDADDVASIFENSIIMSISAQASVGLPDA